MKKEDFKVGQTVYLRLTEDATRGRTLDDLIREAKVVSVGKKYITISYADCNEVKFDLEKFKEKTDYCINYKLFLTKNDAINDIEIGELKRLKNFESYEKILRETKRLLEV